MRNGHKARMRAPASVAQLLVEKKIQPGVESFKLQALKKFNL